MTAELAPARWEVPEAVEPPTLQRFRSIGDAVVRVTGMRAAGWALLLGGLLALLVGLLLRWTEFKVAGALAVVTALLALLFTIGRPKLEVGLRIESPSVVVGEKVTGLVAARNAANRRHWGSRLELPVGRDAATFHLPSLAAGDTSVQEFRIPTERRGLIRIGPAQSVQGDPFALTGRETRWTGALDFHVHPRTVSLPGRQTGFVHDLEGHASPNLTASDMNFHALREYAPGDDRRHVHWRSTARTGQLMVRQFEESRMSRVAVALDTGRAAWLDDDEFELGVSVAASLAVQTIMGESPLALLTSSQTLVTVSPTRALDELSEVELGARGGLADLVHSTRRREPAASVVMCVTGSVASMVALRQACSRFDVDARVVGIRVSTGEELRVRTAGNVTVVQLAALEDLPRAMRKAME